MQQILKKGRLCNRHLVEGSDGARKNCWGARAVKVPIVSGGQESLQTVPIVCLSYCLKRIKKGHGFYEVLTLHGNLGADKGASKNFGGSSPQAPLLAPPWLRVFCIHLTVPKFFVGIEAPGLGQEDISLFANLEYPRN